MKIVSIQYINGSKLAITDDGRGISFIDIEGSISIGASLNLTDKGYKVGMPVTEVCEV